MLKSIAAIAEKERKNGDVADMMLDGALCEGCGVFLNEDPPGYPCRCKSCRKEANMARHEQTIASQRKTKCPVCEKKVKEVGLKDHMRDAHGA